MSFSERSPESQQLDIELINTMKEDIQTADLNIKNFLIEHIQSVEAQVLDQNLTPDERRQALNNLISFPKEDYENLFIIWGEKGTRLWRYLNEFQDDENLSEEIQEHQIT